METITLTQQEFENMLTFMFFFMFIPTLCMVFLFLRIQPFQKLENRGWFDCLEKKILLHTTRGLYFTLGALGIIMSAQMLATLIVDGAILLYENFGVIIMLLIIIGLGVSLSEKRTIDETK